MTWLLIGPAFLIGALMLADGLVADRAAKRDSQYGMGYDEGYWQGVADERERITELLVPHGKLRRAIFRHLLEPPERTVKKPSER
jgi:hypothetical protein